MSSLFQEYQALATNFLKPCCAQIEATVSDVLSQTERVDRVVARVKSVEKFCAKAVKVEDGQPKYSQPLIEIQDMIGIRVIVLFLEDVQKVSTKLLEYFRPIEVSLLQPQSQSEFSYIGWHAVFFIPGDCKPDTSVGNDVQYFEIQVKTAFQHAWSELEHDLVYKPVQGKLKPDDRRLVAFAASMAWGADKAFQDVVDGLEGA